MSSRLLLHKSFTRRLYSTGAGTLKDAVKAAIPEKKELLSKLKKTCADKSLGEVKVAQTIGGMRSIKAMVWEGSELDPVEGIRFHGYSIPEAQAKLPRAPDNGQMLPESMLWLLLTGKIPTQQEVDGLSVELARLGNLPDYTIKLLDNLPSKTLHPMTQFAIAVASLNHDSKFAKAYERGISKNDYWEYTYDDALSLIAKAPQIAAKIYQNTYKDGAPLEGEISESKDWSYNYAAMLGKQDNKGFVNLLRLYLALHGDHEGGNVSAHATHLVGSALSDPFLSYSAGLSGLAGPLHGLAAQEVLRFILDMQTNIKGSLESTHIEEYLWSLLNNGRVIPGYGHAVLRKTDPRFVALMNFADSQPDIVADPVYQLVKKTSSVAPDVLLKHGKTKNPNPNVDSSSGVLLHHYGIKETLYYTVTFGVSRTLGPLSQLIWDRILGLPIERPKSLTLAKIQQIAK